jgi:predicted RNA-binding Zn-ribbon protein involved in translation (DUF1610 family)
MQKVFTANRRTSVGVGKPLVQESLFVTDVISEGEIEMECPMSGNRRQSWLTEPETYVCPLCGVEYEKKGPYDHRDPHWNYTHPQGIKKMTVVTIAAVVGTEK